MGLTVVASASGHFRIAFGQDWLKARRPAEELLIIGPTLVAANEVARRLVETKGASFGYHRMTLGQLASTVARLSLTAQNLVPLGALGVHDRCCARFLSLAPGLRSGTSRPQIRRLACRPSPRRHCGRRS